MVTANVEAARGKPVASRVEMFDHLITISSFAKALAKDVLFLKAEKTEEGGNEDATNDSFSACTE